MQHFIQRTIQSLLHVFCVLLVDMHSVEFPKLPILKYHLSHNHSTKYAVPPGNTPCVALKAGCSYGMAHTHIHTHTHTYTQIHTYTHIRTQHTHNPHIQHTHNTHTTHTRNTHSTHIQHTQHTTHNTQTTHTHTYNSFEIECGCNCLCSKDDGHFIY